MRVGRGTIKRCPHCAAEDPMLYVQRIPAGQMSGYIGGKRFINHGRAGVDLACRRCGWRRAQVDKKAYLPAQEPEKYTATAGRR